MSYLEVNYDQYKINITKIYKSFKIRSWKAKTNFLFNCTKMKLFFKILNKSKNRKVIFYNLMKISLKNGNQNEERTLRYAFSNSPDKCKRLI